MEFLDATALSCNSKLVYKAKSPQWLSGKNLLKGGPKDTLIYMKPPKEAMLLWGKSLGAGLLPREASDLPEGKS